MAGILYIVATPIGNLEDMTFRAVRILQTVNLIAAEDTRHTGKLLQHFQITTPQISYHEHSTTQRTEEVMAVLMEGNDVALVSDAGMPGISDPGYDLIKKAKEKGITIVPIPGANAAVTALAASGLPTDRFVFEGFLPTKAQLRSDRLAFIANETRTIILYEAPHRLAQTLKDLAETLGYGRTIVLAREITKLFEEFWQGSLREAISLGETKNPKGEYTIVIAGASETKAPPPSKEYLIEEVEKMLDEGLTRSQASRVLADLTGMSKREIYKISLNLNPKE